MKYYLYYFSVLFLCVLQFACTTSPSHYTSVKEAVDKVRINFESETGKEIPSLNLLIHTPGENIFISSSNTGEIISRDTNFRFASNTKNFTAAAILKMQEDGWLNIKSEITENIPGCSIPYVPDTAEWNIPNKNMITIEQLLQHSAGVYDVDNDSVPNCGGKSFVEYTLDSDPAHQFTSTELVYQLTKNQLSYFKPGTGHHYSNTGYTILGEIISRIYSFKSGKNKTCTDYLYDYIYGSSSPVPLKIHFPNLASEVSLPAPYISGKIYDVTSEVVYTDQNMCAHVAEGNGYGTMDDLDKYIRSLMKAKNVLSASSIELMKNDISPGSTNYALGCLKISNIGYGHNGCIYGYLSYMIYDPVYDTSLVIMMPFVDVSNAYTSVMKCLEVLVYAGSAARIALGLPGIP